MATKIWDPALPNITPLAGSERIPVATGPNPGQNGYVETRQLANASIGPIFVGVNGSDNNNVGNYPIDNNNHYITSFWQANVDTHSAWNFATGTYTVPVAGFYAIDAYVQVLTNPHVDFTGGGISFGPVVWAAGVEPVYFDDRSQYTQNRWIRGDSHVYNSAIHALNVGDLIKFRIQGDLDGTPGVVIGLANSHMNIHWIRPLATL